MEGKGVGLGGCFFGDMDKGNEVRHSSSHSINITSEIT